MDQVNLSKLLEELALELPKALLARIKSGEATAADLAVARQFLKDNGIMSLPESNGALKGLSETLGDVKLDPPDLRLTGTDGE